MPMTRESANTAANPAPPQCIITTRQRDPPSFAGLRGEDIEEWLDIYERVSAFNRWDDRAKLQNVSWSLDKAAKTWFFNNEHRIADWPDFTGQIRQKFGSSAARSDAAKKQLDDRVQHAQEMYTSYIEDVLALCRRVNGDMPEADRTSTTEHCIETDGPDIVRRRPYSVSPSERKIIDDNVADMLKRKIIRPSASPWSSPVVLVEKKDGSVRFCVDYRALNKITLKDVYPMPRIDDALDCLQGAEYFSSVDLRSGYWQIPLRESNKEKTAFATPGGLYEFNSRRPWSTCSAFAANTMPHEQSFGLPSHTLMDMLFPADPHSIRREAFQLLLAFIDETNLVQRL
ncbi:uncharacterized protein LOC144161538 [Haemaphysalis longicornis]